MSGGRLWLRVCSLTDTTYPVTDRPLAVRFGEDLLARIDKLATALATRAAGAKVSRSEVIRLATERGVEALEREIGKPKKK